jgi:hypothetical protein
MARPNAVRTDSVAIGKWHEWCYRKYCKSNRMHAFRCRSANLCWKPLLAIAGALIATHQVNGAKVNARSPALVDVQSAIALAKDGDIVAIPAGSADWSSVLTITKGITLLGATTVTNAGTQNPTLNDLTIIRDNTPLNTSQSGLIKTNLNPSQSFRLSGFTFSYGSRTKKNNHGAVLLSSTGSSAHFNQRVDHCHFDKLYAGAIETGGWVYGVGDHNYIVARDACTSFDFFHPGYGGHTLGDGAWADYPWFGTDKFFFIENNTLVGSGGAITSGRTDGNNGARFVIRHNYLINTHTGWHGTEGNQRGSRACEIYDNTYNSTIAYTASVRSGTALVHDNIWIGVGNSNQHHNQIVIFREFGGVSNDASSNPFRFGDGSSLWDSNDTEGNGTYVDGNSPHLFASGTVNSGNVTGSDGTMTDTSKNWAVNQWVGYSIKQMNPSAACYGKGSHITSNTSNTIHFYVYGSEDRGATLRFAAGDTYQVHRVLTAVDQVGRGKGDLLGGGGSSRVNTVTKTQKWPHQAVEPAFSWNNVGPPNNVAYGFGASVPSEVLGRDYYNLGKGIPADSTPSQVSAIYGASLNGANYTGTYTYPHPLTMDLLPPSGLAIIP